MSTGDESDRVEHTPSPWLARMKYFGATNPATPYVSHGDTSAVMCFLNLSGAYNGYANIARARADARLIAAAPELLEALEHLMRYDFGDSEGAIKARAAIAKARGGL